MVRALLAMILAATPLTTPAAHAKDSDKAQAVIVQLVGTVAGLQGCNAVGKAVADDDSKDLRRKIVRAGGNAGLLAYDGDNYSAQVFRCPDGWQPSLEYEKASWECQREVGRIIDETKEARIISAPQYRTCMRVRGF